MDFRLAGRVLGPPPADETWWDSLCFSGPVVVPPRRLRFDVRNFPSDEKNRPSVTQSEGISDEDWLMYYHGRDSDFWARGVKALPAPIGRSGLAVSCDGRYWRRVKGPLPGGGVLDPSDDASAFDSVHVSVGDVVAPGHQNEYTMFYFGGDFDEREIPDLAAVKLRGVRMRPGVAMSPDAVHFTRANSGNPVLEVGGSGEWDRFGVSWPRVLVPAEGPEHPELSASGSRKEFDPSSDWLLTYHTRERQEVEDPESGEKRTRGVFSIGAAVSKDKGKTWKKLGKVLASGRPGSWDEGGTSVRSVVRVADGFVMFYEGSNFKNEFAIGVATSADAVHWEKLGTDDMGGGRSKMGLSSTENEALEAKQPGGPVFTARTGEDAWDNIVVGTPYVVKVPGGVFPELPEGGFAMFYLGFGKMEGQDKPRQSIGLAFSNGQDYTKWARAAV